MFEAVCKGKQCLKSTPSPVKPRAKRNDQLTIANLPFLDHIRAKNLQDQRASVIGDP
jgi:hypothetical protein